MLWHSVWPKVSMRSAAEQAIIAFAQSDLMESAAKEDAGNHEAESFGAG